MLKNATVSNSSEILSPIFTNHIGNAFKVN